MNNILDRFGHLACQAIWETLENINPNYFKVDIGVDNTNGNATDPDYLERVETNNNIVLHGDDEERGEGEERKRGTLPQREGEGEEGGTPDIVKPVVRLRYKRLLAVNGRMRNQFPIVLTSEQTVHKNRLTEILNRNPFAFDFSMMGTGKTYVSSTLFQNDGYQHLVCIVPCSVKSKWEYMHLNHGLEIDALISYSELRSARFRQPKHGLLTRRDSSKNVKARDGTNKVVDVTSFKTTDRYANLVDNGVLLVIDEIQNIKNTNDQLTACRELIARILDRYAVEQDIIRTAGSLPADFKRSRVVLLSGSPMDKKAQVIHFYKCLGIMKADRLRIYNPYLGVNIDSGISEIKYYYEINFTEQYRQCNREYYNNYNYTKLETIGDLEQRSYNLFQKIMKPKLSSSMEPLALKYKVEQYNGFFNMETKDAALAIKGIDLLATATNYNSDNNTVDFGNNGISALKSIQRALLMIETSKINLTVRLVDQYLESDPNGKIVVAVNYTETVNDLMRLLSHHAPLRMTGEVTTTKRFDILEKFQRHSNEHRLIVGNLTVLSTGIDLDDTDGRFPRVALVNPNYNAISLYQFGYRFHRAHTKSNSKVFFVFGALDKTELPIIDSLAQKGEVLAETCDAQRLMGIKFPGSYPVYPGDSLSPETPSVLGDSR